MKCERPVEISCLPYCLLCRSYEPTIRRFIREGFKEYRTADMQRVLRKWLYLVTPQARTIIRMRYGLNGKAACNATVIASALNITRQRVIYVHQQAIVRIYEAAKAYEIPDYLIPVFAKVGRYRAAIQEHKVRIQTGQAVRTGKVQRQPCEIANCKARAEAHHEDYSKPLDVRWLCAKHHDHRHAEIRRLGLVLSPSTV